MKTNYRFQKKRYICMLLHSDGSKNVEPKKINKVWNNNVKIAN